MRPIKALVAAAAFVCAAASPIDGPFRRLDRGAPVPAPAPAGPVLVYYGASWCGPCGAFIPELERAYPALKRRGIEVVFVADESCADGVDYARRFRMPWLMLPCDPQRTARLRALGGQALPGIVLLDRDGAVVLSSWHRNGSSAPRAALRHILARSH